MALGVPVKIREGAAPEGHATLPAKLYAQNAARYARDLRRLD
jgi:hypothetical protein